MRLDPLDPLPFAALMGITVVSVAPDLVVGELKVREDLCTRPAVLHGGATMAFADTIGAVATVANLPDGMTTTTIESKTNFFSGIALGDTARAECTPLHKGRTTMVWQTKITQPPLRSPWLQLHRGAEPGLHQVLALLMASSP